MQSSTLCHRPQKQLQTIEMRATQIDIHTIANSLRYNIEQAVSGESNITHSTDSSTQYEFWDRECFFCTTMYVYTARVAVYEHGNEPHRSWRDYNDPTLQGDMIVSVEHIDVVRIDGDSFEDLEIDTNEIERWMEHPIYNDIARSA